MKYQEEARDIWQRCVPNNGQSLTVEGELIRSIEGLRWEAQSNGNINWDEGFEIYCSYLRENLCDSNVFDSNDIDIISDDINRLEVGGGYLETINSDDDLDFDRMPYVEDDLYDRLTDYVILWYRHQGKSIPREINIKQYR